MEKLYILACISNPMNFKSRIQLYEQFRQYIEKEPNVELYTVELIYPGQEYQITEHDNFKHLQLVGDELVWAKENMINLLAKKLPEDWKYVAWVDADVLFARQDWAEETIRKLQTHDVVQMFSECRDLYPNFETIPNSVYRGIVQQFYHNPKFSLSDNAYSKRTGHTGYAWACTRQAWDKMGGLIDFSLMGSADYQMACGWFGDPLASTYDGAYSPGYCRALSEWSERTRGFSLGYVEGLLVHNYHGAKSNRGYNWRWKVLVEAQYDPYEDIHFTEGVMTLHPQSKNFEFLRDQLIGYFRSRNEDEHLGV